MSHEYERIDLEGGCVRILQDDDPYNPRKEFDHIGVMACDHGRYDLGDGTLADMIGRGPGEFKSLRHLERYLGIVLDVAVVKPLYLYDHSGISISAGDFRHVDPQGWDSGMVGVAWITRQKATEASDPEACLLAEIQEYDQYLTGDVWGYVVEDEAGETLDSCWGFYGLDYTRDEAMRAGCCALEGEAQDARWAAQHGIPTI